MALRTIFDLRMVFLEVFIVTVFLLEWNRIALIGHLTVGGWPTSEASRHDDRQLHQLLEFSPLTIVQLFLRVPFLLVTASRRLVPPLATGGR
ncbi:hypothetical protein CDAR_200521 [Caerostris darwini]|uniref:Secreted protein n=1 Tax=Caerostris darwini TaxID=1538125 RepID=A0AAV4TXJ4_9ARAC|nr:hypothetical protein CDAR_200521 [Caerostris darwini]